MDTEYNDLVMICIEGLIRINHSGVHGIVQFSWNSIRRKAVLVCACVVIKRGIVCIMSSACPHVLRILFSSPLSVDVDGFFFSLHGHSWCVLMYAFEDLAVHHITTPMVFRKLSNVFCWPTSTNASRWRGTHAVEIFFTPNRKEERNWSHICKTALVCKCKTQRIKTGFAPLTLSHVN